MLRAAKASFKSLRARRICSTSPCVACCRDRVGAEEAPGAASTHASIKHLAAIRTVQYVIVGLAETVYLHGMPPDPDYNSSPALAWFLRDSGPKQCPTPVIGDRLLRARWLFLAQEQ